MRSLWDEVPLAWGPIGMRSHWFGVPLVFSSGIPWLGVSVGWSPLGLGSHCFRVPSVWGLIQPLGPHAPTVPVGLHSCDTVGLGVHPFLQDTRPCTVPAQNHPGCIAAHHPESTQWVEVQGPLWLPWGSRCFCGTISAPTPQLPPSTNPNIFSVTTPRAGTSRTTPMRTRGTTLPTWCQEGEVG